jgi:hypothetical protein
MLKQIRLNWEFAQSACCHILNMLIVWGELAMPIYMDQRDLYGTTARAFIFRIKEKQVSKDSMIPNMSMRSLGIRV